jgi:hypothetical protein
VNPSGEPAKDLRGDPRLLSLAKRASRGCAGRRLDFVLGERLSPANETLAPRAKRLRSDDYVVNRRVTRRLSTAFRVSRKEEHGRGLTRSARLAPRRLSTGLDSRKGPRRPAAQRSGYFGVHPRIVFPKELVETLRAAATGQPFSSVLPRGAATTRTRYSRSDRPDGSQTRVSVGPLHPGGSRVRPTDPSQLRWLRRRPSQRKCSHLTRRRVALVGLPLPECCPRPGWTDVLLQVA